MKILYLSMTGTLGGAEMCLLDVMASLRGARPEWPQTLIVGEDGPLRAGAEAIGVECCVLPLPESVAKLGDAGLKGRDGKPRGHAALALAAAPAAAAAALYFGRLRKAIRKGKPDVLHANGMKALVLGALAAHRKIPVIWHLHDFITPRPVMAKLLRFAARPGITGAAVSQSVAEDAIGAIGDRVNVQAIYNAVDLERFAPEGPTVDLDAASGLPPAPPGTVCIGLIGTFARWKGQDVFLSAAAKVDPSLAAQARFYIIGGPIYKTDGSQWSIEELKTRAEELKLGDRIGFAGFQPEPAAAIRGLDVVVHASTRPEPFGRVIVEGMACGKAVIAVQGGGSAELFEHEKTALGIPPDNPEALAAAMSRLIADPALRATLGAQGRSSAASRFDRSDLGDRWAAIYSPSNRN